MDDAYDNAPAESIIGLYRTELIRPRCPWQGLEPVGCATLERVDWFNLGVDWRPSETDRAQRPKQRIVAKASARRGPRDSTRMVSGRPGAVQTDIQNWRV